MKVGPLVRRLAGPLEPWLADAYRSAFFDIDDFARRVAGTGPLDSIVEIGCGEGALLERLAVCLPMSDLVGLDPYAPAGRLVRAELRQRLTFLPLRADEYAVDHAGSADLVVICDVLHHVPASDRPSLLLAARSLLRPGGTLIVKEWVKEQSFPYWFGYFSDRYITGERIEYRTRDQWLAEFGVRELGLGLVEEWGLRPWAVNRAFLLRA